VWSEAQELLRDVDHATETLPTDARDGLSSRLRRAAVSVFINIVEAAKRGGQPDCIRFLNLAEASLAEGHYLLVICRNVRHLPGDAADTLISESARLARMVRRERSRITTENIGSSPTFGDQQPSNKGADASALASQDASSHTLAITDEDMRASAKPGIAGSARAREACGDRSRRRR